MLDSLAFNERPQTFHIGHRRTRSWSVNCPLPWHSDVSLNCDWPALPFFIFFLIILITDYHHGHSDYSANNILRGINYLFTSFFFQFSNKEVYEKANYSISCREGKKKIYQTVYPQRLSTIGIGTETSLVLIRMEESLHLINGAGLENEVPVQ